MTENTTRRVWFITGTSSGLGRALAQAALHRGDRVAATARSTDRIADLELQKAEPIDDYAATVGAARELLRELDGNQPNDPARRAAAIIEAIDGDEPPVHLALGADATEAIRAKLDERREELDAWAPVGTTTAFA